MGTSIAPATSIPTARWAGTTPTSATYGLRPACYLDSDLLISVEDGDEDTGVGPQEAGTIVAELVEQFGGTYATGEQFAAEVSFLLGKLRAIREKEADHE